MISRENRLKRLKENPEVSVLIVGAGINGIGTFRDLALQGVDVVMVDRGDYCSGASAASSHMVHGGIRYLENGEFRLVQEAVQERNRLIVNVPHLVKPLATTFPIFKLFSGLMNAPLKFLGLLDRPAERGAVVIKIGMTLYDFFTRKQKTVPRHVFRNRKESLALFPALNPEVRYTGTYFDAAMPSPERIAIELIRDAVKESDQAIPLNYVRLISAQGNMVTLRDEEGGETFDLMPSIVVNAAGPWIDLVNQSIGYPTQFIGGTKGSHLILDHPQLRQAIQENEFFFENKDGRIVLIFPLLDKVMIGTSDIRIDDPDDVVITEEEIDYFFEMIARVFPAIHVDRSHIVFTFSGVRPLQYSTAGLTGQISREHKVEIIEPDSDVNIPILSLVGGKWTSFRAFAEVVTDEVLKRLEKQRRVSTTRLPIGGGRQFPATTEEREALLAEWQTTYQCPQPRAEVLLERYGTRAVDVLTLAARGDETALKQYPTYTYEEIKTLLEEEDVTHLEDLILRRTVIGKLGLVTEPGLQELAQIAAEVLQWKPKLIEDEIERMKSTLHEKHRMAFNQYNHRN